MSGERLSLDPQHAVKSHPFGIINRTKVGGFPVLFLFSFSFSNLFMCRKIKVHTKHSRIQTHLFKSLLRHVVHLYPFIFSLICLNKEKEYTLYKYILICTISILNLVHVVFMCTCKGILFCLWLITDRVKLESAGTGKNDN